MYIHMVLYIYIYNTCMYIYIYMDMYMSYVFQDPRSLETFPGPSLADLDWTQREERPANHGGDPGSRCPGGWDGKWTCAVVQCGNY